MSAENLTGKTAEMLVLLAKGVAPTTLRVACEFVEIGARLNQTLDIIGVLDAHAAIDLSAKQMLFRIQVQPMRDRLDQLRTSFMECYTKDAQHRS